MDWTVWPERIWIKVRSWWQILPQHQSTYLRSPESASLKILLFKLHLIKFSNFFFMSKLCFTIFTFRGTFKGGILIDADSDPLSYVLWCCGSICHQPDTFIQIGSGHTVHCLLITNIIIIHATIFLSEKSLIEFFVYVKHNTYMNSHLFDNMFLFTILVKEKSQAHQNN